MGPSLERVNSCFLGMNSVDEVKSEKEKFCMILIFGIQHEIPGYRQHFGVFQRWNEGGQQGQKVKKKIIPSYLSAQYGSVFCKNELYFNLHFSVMLVTARYFV